MATMGPLPLNKGWVSDSDIWTCPPGGTLTFYGFQSWGGGGAKTLDGYSVFSAGQITSTTTPLGFIYWQDPAQLGAKAPIIVAPSNGKIYTVLTSGLTVWSDRTGSTTPATSGIYTFDSLNGNLLLFNSGGSFSTVPLVITTYNGNAVVLGGSPPIGNIVKVVNNFAFVGQVLASASTQSAVYWSAVSDPTTWPAGNVIQFREGDGDYITALSAIGTTLIIFKQNSFASLSTTTTVLSGAVTLGPLVTISDKIGCVCPSAVDSMPDGTLVFLGTDKHLYQTDGTVFSDLSGLPSPQSNINIGVNFPTSGGTGPIASGIANASVKVDSMFHRIFVLMTDPNLTENPVYVYDYYYRSWANWTELSNDAVNVNGGFGQITCLENMPNNLLNSQLSVLGKSVWTGSSAGYIQSFSPWALLEHASLITYGPCIIETSIPLGFSSPPEFIPRQLIIPISQPSSAVGGQIKVFIGFDGVYSASPAYNQNFVSTIFPSRIFVPVGDIKTNLTVHPLTMQIKIQISGNEVLGPTIVEPIWISDEVSG